VLSSVVLVPSRGVKGVPAFYVAEIDAALRACRRILRQLGFEPIAPRLEVNPLRQMLVALAVSTHTSIVSNKAGSRALGN